MLHIGVRWGGDIYHISLAGVKQKNVVRGEKPLTLFLCSSFSVKTPSSSDKTAAVAASSLISTAAAARLAVTSFI